MKAISYQCNVCNKLDKGAPCELRVPNVKDIQVPNRCPYTERKIAKWVKSITR